MLLEWIKKLFGFFTSSISRKIILPYAVLTLILAAFGIFVVVRLVAGSFEARLKNQLREAAQVVSDEVVNRERNRLEVERLVVNIIGVADALINRDADALNELVSPVMVNSKLIDSLILVDTQGTELLRLQREAEGGQVFINTTFNGGGNYLDMDAVAQVLSDPEGFKSVQIVKEPDTGNLIIYTVGPIQTTEGVVGAALVGTYLHHELAILQNLALANLVLFDESGQVLASTFPLDKQTLSDLFFFFTPERYQEVIANQDVTLLDQASLPDPDNPGLSPEDTQSISVRGQGYRLAYAPFRLRDQTFGVYAVALPTNFITSATDQSRNYLIALFSVGVVTVFGVGYVVSRRISQPILQLVQTSLAIRKGNLDQRTGVKRDDEIGILATTFDEMTAELQQLLKAREEEASRLTAILNSIADGVVVQDTEGRIVVKNPAAEQMLQVLEENFLRNSLQHANQAEPITLEHEQISASLLEYLRSFEFRETRRLEAGTRMFSALSAPVVTAEGERLGTVVVLRDVTREYESEKLKDDFITSMSHELRTPLTAIKGYNELLKLTAADKLDMRQIEFIDTIGANVDDLLEIIQQMLDLSQINAGTLGIDQEPLDFKALLQEEVAHWDHKMKERNVQFLARIPAEEIWVKGDQQRLAQVLHNLIKNAHNYTLPGGNVVVNVSQENGSVQVDIEDSGVGISPENQRFLFRRFFRAIHEEHTFEISGAGLGLYTSKAIVEAHGGKIWMESKLNQGSKFSFSLATITPTTKEDTSS
ncbi:MAG: HAMP domain-containing protein [Chloroflexi bacterium]|nr:MAG: HAMP domain-containing protein [Chloroflexota bacterium]